MVKCSQCDEQIQVDAKETLTPINVLTLSKKAFDAHLQTKEHEPQK
jgi:transcription elongation factor Elf1